MSSFHFHWIVADWYYVALLGKLLVDFGIYLYVWNLLQVAWYNGFCVRGF
jgi:hypothetical protein